MSVGKGIAIAGIWIAVAICSFSLRKVTAVIALFAVFATFFVLFWE